MKNPNSKRDWAMPDGTTTTSFKRHRNAWAKLFEPVERELGLVCTQYHPGALFNEKTGGGSINLPTWFLIRLAKVCEQAAECRLLNEHMAAS